MSQPTAVILGASTDRRKFGNKSVRAHQQAGYDVYPVNPNADEIEGRSAFPALSDVPVDQVDRISVYLPPAVGITLLDEIAQLNPQQVWFNPGSSNAELLSAAAERGLPVIDECSIVDLGLSPSDFPD